MIFTENCLLEAWAGKPQTVSSYWYLGNSLLIEVVNNSIYLPTLNTTKFLSKWWLFSSASEFDWRKHIPHSLSQFPLNNKIWHLSSPSQTKLFVAEELRDHFGAYGEIESINLKTDPNTGRSRGFAFIVFKAPESIDKVMAAGEHTINNKKVDPKKAKARHGKIFVGGLSSEISDDEIKNFFGNFGTVS